VEGVTEDQLIAERPHLLGRDALDRAPGRERDEGGRTNGSVRQLKRPRARQGARVVGLDPEQIYEALPSIVF
jgi:hypothetical protein